MFYLLFRISLFFFLVQRTKTLRFSVVINYLLASVALLIEVLVLSIGHRLSVENDQIYWFLLFVVTSLGLWRTENFTQAVGIIGKKVLVFGSKLNIVSSLMLTVTAVIVSFSLWLGMATPPNNHDAMTATLARVIFWVENGSIGFYPTSELPQLNLGPFASYKFLNHFFITQNDVLVQAVQWEAMVVTLIVMSLIATKLKLNQTEQITTVFLTATLPTGILQATSAQNEYVVISYVVIVFCFFLDYLRSQKISWSDLTWIGVAMGLAVLSKVTALIYLLGLGLMVGLVFLRSRKNLLRNVAMFAVVPILVLSINAFQAYQNYRTFHHVLGSFSEGDFRYLNEKINLETLGVNVTRNLLIHVTVRYQFWNEKTNQAVKVLIQKLGVNFNNKANTWDAQVDYRITTQIADENFTGNFWHLLLVLVMLGWFLKHYAGQSHQKIKDTWFLILPTLLSFLVFCLLLKWQPWHSRLQLAYFILLMPPVALMLKWGVKASQGLAIGIVLVLLTTAAVTVSISNVNKSIVNGNTFTLNRKELYMISGKFFGYDQLIPLSERAAEKGCDNLNLVLSPNEFEYPIWAFSNFKVKINHAFVQNKTGQYALNVDNPGKHCYIVSTDRRDYGIVMGELNQFANTHHFGGFTLVE